jgi:hypothetical protein
VTAGGGDDDDDTFDDSDCGRLLDTIYNTCDLRLVFANGQNIEGENAFTMCQSGDAVDYWACLMSCREDVSHCSTLKQCAVERCNAAMQDASNGDDGGNGGKFLWGCGG